MDQNSAKKLSSRIHEIVENLNGVAAESREYCSAELIERYVPKLGHTMAILFDILDDIYEKHPNIRPDTYKKY